MSDDTSAALIAQLDVKFDQLAKNMRSAVAVFDGGGRQLEKRQAQIKKNLSDWTLNFTGLGGLNKALAGLTAVGIVGGIADLAKHSLDAAAAIADISKQAGVSTDFLQKMRFAGSQTGVSFDSMDEALTTLNKNFGDFVNTGGGRAAKTFTQLGLAAQINSGQIRTAEQAFNFIIPKIAAYGSEAQKSALLAGAFGKEVGPKLLQLADEGAEGIARLEAQAVSLGLVLSGETVAGAKAANDKLDALFAVMKTEGVNAVAQLAPQIAALAEDITKSLPDLITYVEKWAQWFGLIKLSPVEDLKVKLAGANDEVAKLTQQKADNTGWWKSLFGLSDSDFDVLLSAAKARAAQLAKQIASAPIQPFHLSAATDIKGPPAALHVALTPEQIAAQQRQKQFLLQTVLDAKTANAALLAAQDQLNVDLLKGSSGYYDAVHKQIEDEYTAKVAVAQAEADKQVAQAGKNVTTEKGYAEAIANIEDELTDKVAAAAAARRKALEDASLSGVIKDALIQGDQQIAQYKAETDAIGLTAGAAAKLAYEQQIINEAREKGITLTREEIELNPELKKKADDIAAAAEQQDKVNRATQDNIQFADQLRTGLEDVGVAGLKGFGSLKQAAADFLEQIAELIIKLYVMKPLVEGLLGKEGTTLPGTDAGSGLGGILNPVLSLFGFADGGVMTKKGPLPLRRYASGGVANSPQLAMFGEGSGPEAFVPLKNGAIPVRINIPQAQQRAGASGGAIFNFDLRGALMTQDLLEQVNLIADNVSRGNANKAVAQYDRGAPARIRALTNDTRRNY